MLGTDLNRETFLPSRGTWSVGTRTMLGIFQHWLLICTLGFASCCFLRWSTGLEVVGRSLIHSFYSWSHIHSRKEPFLSSAELASLVSLCLLSVVHCSRGAEFPQESDSVEYSYTESYQLGGHSQDCHMWSVSGLSLLWVSAISFIFF